MPTDTSAERLLGKVLAQNEDIIKRLDRAEEARGKMYERFERHNADVAELRRYIEKRIDDLEGRMGTAEKKIDDMASAVARFERYETQGATVAALGPWLTRGMAAVGLAAIAFWREILTFFRGH